MKTLRYLGSCFCHATKEVWPFFLIVLMLPLIVLASTAIDEDERYAAEYGYDYY